MVGDSSCVIFWQIIQDVYLPILNDPWKTDLNVVVVFVLRPFNDYVSSAAPGDVCTRHNVS